MRLSSALAPMTVLLTLIVRTKAASPDVEHLHRGPTHEWIRHLNSMYMFMIDLNREIDTTWSDAAFACKSQGGYLVSIESSEERLYLEGRIQELVASQGQKFAFEQWWTSGRHKDDGWWWELDDGKDHPVEMMVSRGHHEANAKVALGLVHDQSEGWRLKPIPATYRLRYICEREAVPELLLSQPPEEHLLAALFRKYDRDARGLRTSAGTVNVMAAINISNVHVVAGQDPFLRSSGTLSLAWRDERLTWIPGQYENLTHAIISANRLWIPPLDFVNSLSDSDVFSESSSHVFINYQGHILWERRFRVVTVCHVDATYFPFDSCACALLLHTSGYPVSYLDITLNHTAISVQEPAKEDLWRIKEYTSRTEPRETLSKSILRSTYAQFVINMEFVRQSRFYVVAYIIPSMVTSLLMVLTFVIPTGVSERITSSLVVYVSYTILALGACSDIPMDSERIPVLASHFLVSFLLLSLGLGMSWFAYRLSHYDMDVPFPVCMLGLGARARRTSKLKHSPNKEIQLASLSSLKKGRDDCMTELERRNTCASLQKTFSQGFESSQFTPDLATPCNEEEKHHFLNTYRGLRERLDNAENENHWYYFSERLNRTFAVILFIMMFINNCHFFIKCIYQ